MNSGTTVFAPAKLTLTLRMVDKRADGFNNLEALTVFLPGINDCIEISSREEEGHFLQIFNSDGSQSDLPVDGNNLVSKAYGLFSRHIDVPELSFKLTKTIPSAAGLGGGSADAAAVLRALNEFTESPFSISELVDMASEIGSDIPACVHSKALWMKGRGEIVEEISNFNFEAIRVLVITPRLKCSTSEVFAKYDAIGRPIDSGLQAPVGIESFSQDLHNDLALAAYELFPELVDLREFLKSQTQLPVQLAGSGSSMYVIGESSKIEDLRATIEKTPQSQDWLLCCTSSIE
jgi:4-diphosphocytidyl-2-C-methyl-D-erythritol kinase